MARANAPPTMDAMAGAAALDQDLPRVLRALDAVSLDALGWSRPNRLSLIVPMTGVHLGKSEAFTLKLAFQAYRTWPPSAQFVNPETLAYNYPIDRQHVPILTSPGCHSHPEYDKPGGGKMQLICCSATLEFYEVLHSVQPEHVWRDTDTFLTTIDAIQKALASHFGGRFPAYGQ
jgi:hypothetical protein